MKITFNPSTVAALTSPPNNKDITFDLKGHNIFARGVEFKGTDTNTWRDIKINNVSIGSNILDLCNGTNTTLTNINGVVTINSTWRPIVDNLASNSTTSSLSANQGRVLKALIDGKSDSGHNHDDRYLRLIGGTLSGALSIITPSFGALIIQRNDTTNGASIQFKGSSSIYGYIGFNKDSKDKQLLRWNSSADTSFSILDTSTTYVSSNKGYINGTEITQVNNANKWTAARTFTIGNTSKNVDGSNNVSWSLSEIGAASSGHNHDGRYVRAFGTSNDNIDSDWGQSFKTFDPIPSGTPPEKNPNISLLSIGENFNRRKQLAFVYSSDNIYYRRHVDDGFTNWKRIAFANEIPSSLKNPHALTISLNGTSQGPYDGSVAMNINITPGSIGAATSDHNHDGRYVRYYAVTTLDCNNLAAGLTAASVNATNAGAAYHSAYLYISDVGTPFQIQIPDSGTPYIYKRYYSSGKWSGWFKLNAGYADSAGSVAWANVTGKPSSFTPSAHTHAWNSLTHSSTTENQAILTNGKANGWKLYTLNISGWNNAANNAHSHSNKLVLDGITSALISSWNTAYSFVDTITKSDTDKVINKWNEIVNFLSGISSDNKLNTLLNSKLSVYELASNTNVGAIKNNGIYYSTTDASSGTLINSPFNTGFALINMTSYDGGDDLRRFRLAFNGYGEIKVSNDRGQNNTTETWYQVLTSHNTYISNGTGIINGATITQVANATNASVASKVYGQVGDTGSHELVRCDMSNDQFRIIAGSSNNNNGWAEIATSDDGNEPIYVRQYTGIFGTVKRTLTLLDANGYSHFPSYINIGGNENNNSSPDRVWGSNSSDSYLRSYRTSALKVSYASSAGSVAWSNVSGKPDTATRWPSWKEVTNKPDIEYIVPTLSHVPTSSTLTFVENGITKQFKIGYMCRVADSFAKYGYKFYQLYNISGNNAVWGENTDGDYNETVIVNVTSNRQSPDNNLIGAVVTIKNTSTNETQTQTWKGTVLIFKIPAVNTYTVSVSNLSNYTAPVSQSYTAGVSASRNVVMRYMYYPIGIFIQDIDTHFITVENWNTANNNKAVGVYVGTENSKFVIAPVSDDQSIYFGGSYIEIPGVVITRDSAIAKKDYAGETNTDKIITKIGAQYATAAQYCRNYTFKNGKKGYLWSLGEAFDACSNISAISKAMDKLGITFGYSFYLWTSTQYSDNAMWCIDTSNEVHVVNRDVKTHICIVGAP